MDARITGRYIALKRRELGITQEELAEQLGITGKAVSKWENGRCLPDGAIMQPLCESLGVSFNELMSGKDIETDRERSTAETVMKQALDTIGQLQREKRTLIGILVIMLGITTLTIGQSLAKLPASEVMDFLAGFLVGLSIVEILVGIFFTIRSLAEPH